MIAYLAKHLTGEDVFGGWDNFERDVMLRTLRVAHEKLQPALIRMRLFSSLGDVIGAEMLALPVRGKTGVELMGGLFSFTEVNMVGVGTIKDRQLVTARIIWTEALFNSPEIVETASTRTNIPLRVIQGGRTF